MPRSLVALVVAAAVVALAVTFWLPGSQAQPGGQTLPGARPAIDASKYPSLQAAIDALGSEGGAVRLPAGRFEISQPLVISSDDVLLEGQGTATHIVNTNTAGQPALVVRPKDANNRQAHLWRVQLSNFRITGNDESGHGIEAVRVNELFIQGVTVSQHGQDGIRLDHCYEDPRVANSLITYNKQTGLKLIGCHDIVVAANQFEENRDALECLDGFNLCMTGNCLDDHLRHGVVIENTYGSVVAGNMIEECQGIGIILDRDCYGIALSANVIAHEFSGGIALRDAHGCAVTGNSFPIVWKDALLIGPDSSRIAVTGNAFSGSTIGPGTTRRPVDKEPASGITLSGTSEVGIVGNLFSGLQTKAIARQGDPSRALLVVGNLLADTPADPDNPADSHVADNLGLQVQETESKPGE